MGRNICDLDKAEWKIEGARVDLIGNKKYATVYYENQYHSPVADMLEITSCFAELRM